MAQSKRPIVRAAVQRWSFPSLLLLAACQSPGASYQSDFLPAEIAVAPKGKPNEVLVLGTPHLAGLPDSFTPEMLSPLLDKLAQWRPTGIATEDVSGLQCDAMRRYPVRYAETVETYCSDTDYASKMTGLDVPSANAEAERTLASWPQDPAPAERRRLASVFIAAGERGSALVQWLRLSSQERRGGDGLDARLVADLEAYAARRNETSLISAELAARLGLERLWSVDDHTADAPEGTSEADGKAAAEALKKAWDNPFTRARKAQDERLMAQLGSSDSLLTLYRTVNAPDMPMLVFRSDFGAALSEGSSEQFGRAYVGYWETRNLRMVGNIRDVLGRTPGMRLLAIVGTSHKGYYEAYLSQMHDVRLVDPILVLGGKRHQTANQPDR